MVGTTINMLFLLTSLHEWVSEWMTDGIVRVEPTVVVDNMMENTTVGKESMKEKKEHVLSPSMVANSTSSRNR